MDSLFRNTLGPLGWLVLGLIPFAIFALYFLKLKRQPVEVPSTYLWNRVIEDLHVNSLWQRLRRSLLLFLQLLLIGLAMLALLRPGWQGQKLSGQRFIFLVDNSASMSATDALEGKTRLEAAKERVAALVDQLEADMPAMIISFADGPQVVQEFTDNKRLLHDALERIEQTAGQTDLSGALELADGFANPVRVTEEEQDFEVAEENEVELYIFSDGRFGGVKDFSLGNLHPLFLPLGSFESPNLAISAFNTRRSEDRPEIRQAFAQVANFTDAEQKTVIELFLDEQLFDAAELTVPAGGVAAATFNLSGKDEGKLLSSLDIPAEFGDKLPLDNQAFAILEDRRDGRVLLVTPGNRTVESALSTRRADRIAKIEKITPETLLKADVQAQLQSEIYDLVIFDQCLPETMPQANTLMIGRLPPLASWSKEGSDQVVYAPQIIDWQRGHPLLDLVELGNVQIADTLLVSPPLGGRVLIDSTRGPLLAIAPRDRYEDAVLGFEIVGTDGQGNRTFNTDWPRKHSFPSFWLNVLEYFAGNQIGTPRYHLPGRLVELRIPGESETVSVEMPDGIRRKIDLDEPGRLTFSEADQLGIYQVRDGQTIVKRFAVNLFDREESDVALRVRQDEEDGVQQVESLSIGYVDVQAQSPALPVRKELWKLLLIGALVVLVVEWYIYNRWVYI